MNTMSRNLDASPMSPGSLSEEDMASMDALIRPFGSLSDLLLSPSVLSSEASLLTSELTSLCHTSQPTFLLLHNTSSTLSSSFDTLSSSLDSLLDTLPTLATATHHFTKTTKPILEERRKASLVLEQQEKLADLLEMPALIDTCSRNGQYQDALELSMHADALWQQFKKLDGGIGTSGIIDSLEREVRGSVRLLLGGLVDSLKGRAKLPILYKAIGFLQKMGGWDEEELAVLFLCCRSASLEELHGANEADQGGQRDAAKYLRGYIDVFREGVYDVVTAYITIFLDHAQYSHSQKPTSGEMVEELRFLLAVFTNNQIAHLISTLSSNLPKIEDFTPLASLLTQLNYCGTAFARVGLEFRPLISGPFEGAVSSHVKYSMNEANVAFIAAISEGEKSGLPPSSWLVSGSSSAAGLPGRTTPSLPNIPDHIETKKSAAMQTHLPAPQVLTFSPVLATFLNSHLNTLNSLRLLPIISLLPFIYSSLCQSLAASMRALLDYARTAASPASPTLRVSFERRSSEIALNVSPNRRSVVPSSSGAATSATDPTTGPMSPGVQRPSSIASRTYSPSPRQSGILGEDAKAKQEIEHRVLLTVGKAFVRVLVPFLKKGLVQEVYGRSDLEGEYLDAGEGAKELLSVTEDWEKWSEEWISKAVNGGGT